MFTSVNAIGSRDWLGKTTVEVWPPETAADFQARDLRVRTEGSSVEVEYQVRYKEGVHDWLNVLFPIRDDSGGIRFLGGISIDITKRKNVERALLESERRFRSFFEDTPISIWEEDWSGAKRYLDSLRDSGVRDFRAYFKEHPEAVVRCLNMVKVLDVNSATLDFYGAVSKEEFKKGLSPVFSDKSFETFAERLIFIAEGKTEYELEVVNQTLNGEKKDILVKWVVTPGHEETLSRALSFIIDLSELKRHQTSESILRQYSAQILSAREDEKRSLSINMHDEMGSLSVALGTSLKFVETGIKGNNPQEALYNIRQTRDILNRSIANLRRMAVDLMPHNLAIVGLPAVLQEYFQNLEEQSDLEIDFKCSFKGKKLKDKTAIALYRVAQESLNNIIKHSGADRIRVQRWNQPQAEVQR